MSDKEYSVVFPELNEQVEQNEEWIILQQNGDKRRLLLHDYGELYNVPGLYEKVFYEKLQCDSPNVVCSLLGGELEKAGVTDDPLRVFDFGAGNGIVGEKMAELGCDLLVGVDILEEAKDAAHRDRPGLYDEYYVLDLTNLKQQEEHMLTRYDFNTLVTVAALGFNDIPTMAFLNAFNLLQDDGWVAFNIKDRFLTEDDLTGYKDLLGGMLGNCLDILQDREYCHRLSLTGEELCYRAIVGRKTADFQLDGTNN